MTQGVPFLLKNCPSLYAIDSSTGLCTLFNPWLLAGIGFGAGLAGFAIATALHHTHRLLSNPIDQDKELMAMGGLGAGLSVGLIAKAVMPMALPIASASNPVPISATVAKARQLKATVRKAQVAGTMATPACQSGCMCINTTQDFCTAGEKFIQPSTVAFLVSFVNPTTLPSQYDFTSNVAQWIGFFSYRSDPSRDTWCPPRYTYSIGAGDCEDVAMLSASVLLAGGVNAHIMIGQVNDPSNGTFGHSWTEGTDAQGWFMIEATNGTLYRDGRPSMYVPVAQISQTSCTWLGNPNLLLS